MMEALWEQKAQSAIRFEKRGKGMKEETHSSIAPPSFRARARREFPASVARPAASLAIVERNMLRAVEAS